MFVCFFYGGLKLGNRPYSEFLKLSGMIDNY